MGDLVAAAFLALVPTMSEMARESPIQSLLPLAHRDLQPWQLEKN